MVLVDVESSAGYPLAKEIADDEGRLLLAAGTELTPGMAAVLARRGYRGVYVEVPDAEDVQAHQAIEQDKMDQAAMTVRQVFTQITAEEHPAIDAVRERVGGMLGDLGQNTSPLFELTSLRSSDEYTYTHSANTCAYALLLGRRLGLDVESEQQLGMGALLLDVGKAFCHDLCAKEGPLTEDELRRVQRHAEDGYTMLRRYPEVPLYAAHVAFQHHERLDGRGYPRGLRGDRIMPLARITAIADAFAAMTCDRPYAKAMPVEDAMRTLLAGAGTKYDAEMLQEFVSGLAVFPAGSLVLLENGSVAVVVRQGTVPRFPVVRVLGQRRERVAPYEMALDESCQVRHLLYQPPTWLR